MPHSLPENLNSDLQAHLLCIAPGGAFGTGYGLPFRRGDLGLVVGLVVGLFAGLSAY